MARNFTLIVAQGETTSDHAISADGVSYVGLKLPSTFGGATHVRFLVYNSLNKGEAVPLYSGGVMCLAPLIGAYHLDLTEEVPELLSCRFFWLELCDPLGAPVEASDEVIFLVNMKDLQGRAVTE